MANSRAMRWWQPAGLVFLGLTALVLVLEWSRPSTGYWWRIGAEQALTTISSQTGGGFGLTAAKLAFRLRQGDASDRTVEQLARAARREHATALSAVTDVYRAHRELRRGGDGFALASAAFETHASPMTAWQVAAIAERAGASVPGPVRRVLLSGPAWEYPALLRVEVASDTVAEDVLARQDEIDDGLVVHLASTAKQSAETLAHWSRDETRAEAIAKLHAARPELARLAAQNRFAAMLGTAIGSFLERTLDGLADLFQEPSAVDAGLLATKAGRRFMATIDAIGAIGTAASHDEKILRARRALPRVDAQIADLESGRTLRELRDDLEADRQQVRKRLHEVRSNPRRYRVDEQLVLAALRGEDAHALFLSMHAPAATG